MIPYIIKPNSVSMFPAGEAPILIDSSHVNFKDVVESIKAFDYFSVRFICLEEKIQRFS
jgi:hypothetical protein